MSLRSQVVRAIEANPGLPHNVLARKIAADLGEPALVTLAIERIERMITSERRRRIRDLEDEQTDPQPDTGSPEKWAVVDALLQEFKNAVIVEWTGELLAAEFATGDGATVTWGTATAEQHVARIGLLSRNVRGNLTAIQRHEAALAHLAAAGVGCLNEVPR